jgi:RNA polymerase sigma-70 factor (ECF subfamily)
MQTASLALEAQPAQVKRPTGFLTTPAFGELYQRYSEPVYRTALRVTGDPADAEDVLQTVFLRILDHRLNLDPLWSPERYLRRAATNAAIDLIRRRTTLAETAMDERRDYGSRESTVLLKEGLRRAIAKLPEQDAELFVLCYLEGYTYDELAEQFQMERGTVGSRLHRIRAVLQKSLTE